MWWDGSSVGQFGRWDGKQTYIEALVRRLDEAERAGNEARAGAIAARLMAEFDDLADDILPLVTSQDAWLRLTLLREAVPPALPDLRAAHWDDEVVF